MGVAGDGGGFTKPDVTIWKSELSQWGESQSSATQRHAMLLAFHVWEVAVLPAPPASAQCLDTEDGLKKLT